MDKMPFLAILLQSIPESIIILCLGLAIIGIRPDFRKVLPAAILSSMVSWLVRDLTLPFGVHTIIGVITVSSLFIIFFRISPLKAIVATLFAFSSLIAVEAVLVPIITNLVGIAGFQDAWGHPILRVVLAVPELILLCGLAYLLIKFNISFGSLAHKKGDNPIQKEYQGR